LEVVLKVVPTVVEVVVEVVPKVEVVLKVVEDVLGGCAWRMCLEDVLKVLGGYAEGA